MRTVRRASLAAATVLAVSLTACGGQDSLTDPEPEGSATMSEASEHMTEPDESEPEGQAEGTCEGEALTAAETGLPADFPMPDGLVLVEADEAGPSNTADGYFDGELATAFDTIKSALEDAGYAITFDEQEADDAEIAYESPDASSTGIVELRARCGSEDLMAVHVVDRPAA